MALGDSYATLAELKTRLGITDTNDDTVLTAALASASRAIGKYCRRQFNDAGAVSARYFYPMSRFLVEVDDFSTTTGLILELDTDDDGVYETLTIDTDFQNEPLNGIRDGETGWPFWRIRAVESEYFRNGRRASVKVTARWGWAAIPAPVKEATLALAEETFKMKDSPYGIAGMGEFGFVRVRENPKIVSLLKDYRRVVVRVR